MASRQSKNLPPPPATETQTQTATVTSTKLMVATAALAAAGGLALMLMPPTTLEDYNFYPLFGEDNAAVYSVSDDYVYSADGTDYAAVGYAPASGELISPPEGTTGYATLVAPEDNNASPSVVCGDSDGGKVPGMVGTVSLFNPNGLFILSTDTDSCADADTVKEYFCDSPPNADPQSYVFENMPCGLGNKCLAGECKLAPRLTFGIDNDTPEANNYLMGTIDNYIAKFYLTAASSTENIVANQIVASFDVSQGANIFLKNLKLVDLDTGKQVGPTIATVSQVVNGKNINFKNYFHATFSGLNLTVPKGVTKRLAVVSDFTTYEMSNANTTGQTISPALLTTFSGNAADVAISGVGAMSGLPAFAIAIPNHQDGVRAKELTLYRAKLLVAWAANTPSGAASPSSAQTVGKFLLTNLANSGTYPVTVQVVNLRFLDSNVPATATRTLKIYKDSLATTELAAFYYRAGERFFGESAITDANFTDVFIGSGSSKTFYATLDTTDFYANSVLSAQIPDGGVVWNDGVTPNITAMGRTLPLDFKTFSY